MALTDKGRFQVCSTLNGTYTEFQAKSLSVLYESLASDESGRTEDGAMHIYWVYHKLRKIEIELPPTSNRSLLSSLLTLVLGQEYYIKYWDPLTNAERTSHVYTSNSNTDMYSGVLYNGMWQGVKFNAIELAGE